MKRLPPRLFALTTAVSLVLATCDASADDRDGRLLARLQGASGTAVAFGRDGKRLAIGYSKENRTQIWEVPEVPDKRSR